MHDINTYIGCILVCNTVQLKRNVALAHIIASSRRMRVKSVASRTQLDTPNPSSTLRSTPHDIL